VLLKRRMDPEADLRLSIVKVVRWGLDETWMDPVSDWSAGQETALMAEPEIVTDPLKVEQAAKEARSASEATTTCLAHPSIEVENDKASAYRYLVCAHTEQRERGGGGS